MLMSQIKGRIWESIGWSVATFLAPFLSGLLLGIAMRYPRFGWVAWLSLVPMSAVLRWDHHCTELYAGAFCGGVAFHFLALDFIRTDVYGVMQTFWVVQAYLQAPYFVGAVWCARTLVLRQGLPIAVALPLAWVSMETVRRYSSAALIEFGLPLSQLGSTQIDQYRLIQVADILGVAGISWIVASWNGMFADVWFALRRPIARRRLAFSVALGGGTLIGAWIYGEWRMVTASPRPGPRVALMPYHVPKWSVAEVEELVRRQLEERSGLDRRGAGELASFPDLLVWSEDSYYGVDSLFVPTEAQSIPDTTSADPNSGRLVELTKSLGAAVAIGVVRSAPSLQAPLVYNSLVYYTPTHGYSGCYDKMHLAPGLEFQPRLGRFVSWLTGKRFLHPATVGNSTLEFGTRFPVFHLDSRSRSDGYRFASGICYDAWFPEFFRTYLAPQQGRSIPDFFVIIANEGDTAGAERSITPWLSLTACRFLAIETRRPVVRCCFGGLSAVIDSCGRILQIDGGTREVRKAIVADIPIDGRASFYAFIGYLFPIATTLATAVLVICSLRRADWVRSIRSVETVTRSCKAPVESGC
jgi:apolipoprotein N-acyltransferase